MALRRRLAKAHRILTAGGIWPLTKGHVSARIPGTDRVLILGHIHSEGRSLIDTDVDDIVTVDLEGKWLEGRIEPVDERFLHLEIMKTRPDVTFGSTCAPDLCYRFRHCWSEYPDGRQSRCDIRSARFDPRF